MPTTLWPGPRPIREAPIRADERCSASGSCLVAPGLDGDERALGYWDGRAWFTADGGDRLEPRFFLLLPPIDTL